MNQEKLLWTLSEKLRGKLSSNDYMIEVGLLLAWKTLCESNTDLTSLEDVINGKTTLMMAYKSMASLQQIGDVYHRSILPGLLTQNEVEDILSAVKYFDGKSIALLMNDLYSLGGKSLQEVGLPNELVDLITQLGLVNDKTVYAPFSGSIGLAVKAKEVAKSVSVEAVQKAPVIAISSVLSGLGVTHSDPLRSPSFISGTELIQFDCVLMNPPFGLKIKDRFLDSFNRFSKDDVNGDVMCVQHALSQTKGRLVTLATQGLLFRNTGSYYDWRIQMINNGWIDTVIQLPSNLLFNTSIPAVIIVIDKLRNTDSPVLFFDAEQDELYEQGNRGQRNKITQWQQIADEILNKNLSTYSRLISKEELINNDYDLSVRRYVLGAGSAGIKQLSKTESLESLAEIVRAQLLKNDPDGGDPYLEVCARDIDENGIVMQPAKSMTLSGRMRDRAELQKIQPGDIIFSTKGSIGKVGIVTHDCGDNWVVNQTFQVIRLKSTSKIVDPAYLYMYLKSSLVQAYLTEQASGSAIQVLKTGDVKNLPIQVGSQQEQQDVIGTYNEILDGYEKIRGVQSKIEKLSSNFWSC